MPGRKERNEHEAPETAVPTTSNAALASRFNQMFPVLSAAEIDRVVLYLLQAAFMFLVASRLYGLRLEVRGFVRIGEMGATLAEAWRSWGVLWSQALIYGLTAAYLMSRQRRAEAGNT